MTDPESPFNDELTVADARNFSTADPLAGGTVMAGPPDMEQHKEPDADAAAAAAPASPAPDPGTGTDIEFPFFMSSEIPETAMRDLELQAMTHQVDIEKLVATYQAERRQAVIDMQRRARRLHEDLEQQDKEKRLTNIVDISDALGQQLRADPAPPWYGITLACLLISEPPPLVDDNDRKRSLADMPASIRAQTLISHYGRDHAETADGGRLEASPSKLTIRKGSEQALELIFAEAQARGWNSIEASGTKEFCRNLCAMAQKYNMKVTAYPNFPGRVMQPPFRYTPLPGPGGQGPTAETDAADAGADLPTDSIANAARSPESRFPRVFRDTGEPPQPEDPVTGEAYRGDCGPDRPDPTQDNPGSRPDLDDDIDSIPSLTPP